MSQYRHWVDAFEPPKTLGSRGQRQGHGKRLMRNIPASIETLSGREAEVARQIVPQATLMVKIHGPIPGLAAKCYFLQHPITDASKPIHIGYVNDVHRNGRDLHCTCTEEV